jgi:hypothetical protein
VDRLDRVHERTLRAIVFANFDGLFALHCSAEDAHDLVQKMGKDVDVEDLVALGEHRCYARFLAREERLPTFSVRLDPPAASDQFLVAELASESAPRYGCDRGIVEEDLRAAIERIQSTREQQDNANGRSGTTGVSGGTSGNRRNSQSKDYHAPQPAARSIETV